MITLTCTQIAEVVGGTVSGLDGQATEALVTSVVVDSRDCAPGAMFVAINGTKVDGHDFADAAVAQGAVVVLAGRPLTVPCIVVDDPIRALGRLAAWVRATHLNAKVIAITGSSGKTSTKDLVASTLGVHGSTVAAPGSFNTEIGVPLTILGADPSTQYLVLEMGMRGLGHIDLLCGIAAPDISVIVNIGSAHLGMLGSVEAVARAKGEIIQGLSEEGVAVLNGDDPRVMAQVGRTSARVVTFGTGPECHIRATDVRLDAAARASFTLHSVDPVAAVPVTLRYAGPHFVSNALAAGAVALACGVPVNVVASALRDAEPASPMRMQVHEQVYGISVINDAYNANPESMEAALRTLTAMAAGRRSWAVLGEMRELGEHSPQAHRDIGRLVGGLRIQRLIAIGAFADDVLAGAGSVAGWAGTAQRADDPQQAAHQLRTGLLPDDIVLVKASRSLHLETVIDQVFDDPSQLTCAQIALAQSLVPSSEDNT